MREQLYHTVPEDWKLVPATGERGEKRGSGDGSTQGWGRNAALRVVHKGQGLQAREVLHLLPFANKDVLYITLPQLAGKPA